MFLRTNFSKTCHAVGQRSNFAKKGKNGEEARHARVRNKTSVFRSFSENVLNSAQPSILSNLLQLLSFFKLE